MMKPKILIKKTLEKNTSKKYFFGKDFNYSN